MNMRNFVIMVLVIFQGAAAWAGTDETLAEGAQALREKTPEKSLEKFSSVINAEGPSRLQQADAYAGRCAARYKQSLRKQDLEMTREAISDCNQAIALRSDHHRSYRLRGTAYLTAGYSERALEDLNVAFALDPKDHLTLQNRGLANAKLGHSHAAIADFNAAINLQPNHPWSYYNRGRLHAANDRQKQAIKDFSGFIRLKRGYSPVFLHRGRSLMLLGNYRKAMADFNENLRLQPTNNPTSQAYRGITLFLLGRYQEAARDFKGVLAYWPGNLEDRIWLSLALKRAGKPDGEAFAGEGGSFDAKTWPGAAVAFLQGHVTAKDMLSAARSSKDRQLAQEREGLAMFLLGENALIHNRIQKAREWFRRVGAKTAKKPGIHHAARQELRRIRAGVRPVRAVVKKSKSVGKTSDIHNLAVTRKQAHLRGKYAFKIASFMDSQNADDALREATELKLPVFVEEVKVKGIIYLRVWVGPFRTRSEALKARKRIAVQSGHTPSPVHHF